MRVLNSVNITSKLKPYASAVQQSNVYTSHVRYDEQIGLKTPKWSDVVREQEGPLPVNAYDRRIMEGGLHTAVQFWGSYTYPKGAKNPSGGNSYANGVVNHCGSSMSFDDFVLINAVKKAEMTNEARKRFQDNIENTIVEAPLEIAELDKTANTIVNRVKKMGDFAHDFVRKRSIKSLLRDARKRYRKSKQGDYLDLKPSQIANLNGMYLEWTYGWGPLMGLFGDLSDLYMNLADKHATRTKVSGHYFQAEDLFTTQLLNQGFNVSGSVINNIGRYNARLRMEWRHDIWVGGLLNNVYPSQRESLAHLLGVTVENIIPTLWELTWCSFIADYFINIGDFLGNLRNGVAKMNASSLYISELTVGKQYWDVEILPTPDTSNISPFLVRSGCNAQAKVHSAVSYINFTRRPMSPIDTMVRLELVSPSWHQVFNTVSVGASLAYGYGKANQHTGSKSFS